MTTAMFAARMRQPSASTELFEFNLGRAPDLRCAMACDRCETCSVMRRLIAVRSWFAKAGDRTRRTFILGLCQRLRSAALLRQLLLLLRPLACKDFTYARVRMSPALPGDSATMSDNRALSPHVLNADITDTWSWFQMANYWSKVNFLLALLNDCEAHLLHLVAVQARTLLTSEQPECTSQTDYEDSSVASTCYDPDNDQPDSDVRALTTPSRQSFVSTSPHCTPRMTESRCTQEDEDEVQSSSSSGISIDPTCLVVPTSVKAYSGVARHRDFVRCLPVHLSKYVLGYLDRVSLFNCVCVSRHWRMLVEEVHREFYVNQNLWEEVMLMQGAAAKSCNPVYAKDIDVTVPNVIPGTYKTIRTSEDKIETVYKSEANLTTAYSSYETRNIIMEERNVYCGAYNVMVLINEVGKRDVQAMHTDGGPAVALGGHDRKIRFINSETGKPTGPVISGHAGSIRSLVLSHKLGIVLSGSYDTSIRCWSLQSGKCEKIFRGHSDTVTCMKIHDNWLASGSKDGTCKVWRLDTGKCIRTFRHRHAVSAIALSADVCVSGCEGGAVKVWQLSSGERIKKLTGHHGMVTAISFDVWHIVTASKDGYALAWSAQGDHTRCLTALRHPTEVLCLAFMYLRVVTGSEDGKLRIWNMVTGQCMRIMRGNSRSDCIKEIIAIDNRVTVHTTNNLLVLTFEQVEYDYTLECDRMPSLVQHSRYSDKPLRMQPYAYVRAQRMRRAGASNTKIVHHDGGGTAGSIQTRHSARTLSQRNVTAAKRIQSAEARLQTRSARSSASSSIHQRESLLSTPVSNNDEAPDRRVSWAFESIGGTAPPLSLLDTKALLRSQIRANGAIPPPSFVQDSVSAIQARMRPVDCVVAQRQAEVRQERLQKRPASSPSRVDPRTKVPPQQLLAEPLLAGRQTEVPVVSCDKPKPATRPRPATVTCIVTEFAGKSLCGGKMVSSSREQEERAVRTSIPKARVIRPHTATIIGEHGSRKPVMPRRPKSTGSEAREMTLSTPLSSCVPVPMLMYPRDMAERLQQLKLERAARRAAPPVQQHAHHVSFT